MSGKTVRWTRLKEYRFAVVSSCAAILLCMLTGVLLWNRLPAEVAVHFDFSGQPDSYAPRAFAVFGMPLILLAFQLICVFAAVDMPPQQRTMPLVVLWIVPIISLCVMTLLYVYALGSQPNIQFWMQLTLGTVFILLGNAFPKGAASIRLGRRLRHLPLAQKQQIARFYGYCLVVGGIAACLCALAGSDVLFIAIVAAVTAVPLVYVLTFCRRTSPDA